MRLSETFFNSRGFSGKFAEVPPLYISRCANQTGLYKLFIFSRVELICTLAQYKLKSSTTNRNKFTGCLPPRNTEISGVKDTFVFTDESNKCVTIISSGTKH